MAGWPSTLLLAAACFGSGWTARCVYAVQELRRRARDPAAVVVTVRPGKTVLVKAPGGAVVGYVVVSRTAVGGTP